MQQLKLLRAATRKEGVNALADVAWIFFSFQLQEYAWLHPEALRHCYDRIKAWHLFPALYITPEIASYTSAFSCLLKAELRRFSQSPDSLSK